MVGAVEVLLVVVVVPFELEVTLVADEELVLPDSVVFVADEVCFPGIIITSASAPATTNTTMRIKVVIRTFDRARVCGATVAMYDSFPYLLPDKDLCRTFVFCPGQPSHELKQSRYSLPVITHRSHR